MAQHGKKAAWRARWTTKKTIIAVAALCLVAAIGAGLWWALSRDESRPVVSPDAPASSEAEKTMADYPRTAPVASMKAAMFTPGVDYYTDAGNTPADMRSQIDKALASCEKWEFNTIIADTRYQGKPLYASALGESLTFTDGSERFDPLAYLVEQAHQKHLTVYALLDLRVGQAGGFDPQQPDVEHLCQSVQEALDAYDVEGYYLTGYACPEGSAAGDSVARQTAIDSAVQETVMAVLKKGGRSIGLFADPVWASTDTTTEGIKATDVYQDFTDGGADTRRWLQEGWFDSVLLKNYTSLGDKTLSFSTVLTWWDKLCTDRALPLFVAHAAEKAGGDESGWSSPDQLPRQYLAAKKAKAYAGSAFGVAALQRNTDKTTDVLLNTMAGKAKTAFLEDKLALTSPKEKSTTTLESRFTLQGSADPNFPLLLNGKTLEVSDHGYFAKDVTLSPGKNTFTFRHKGQKVTYTVTYEIQVLKSVAPVRDVKLEGGTAITISAIARKGATVSATVGSTTVKMQSAPLQMENGSEDLSDYENFSGVYVLPAGVTGKVQSLGAVKVRGKYQGVSQTMKGGRLFVAAKKQVSTGNTGSSSSGSNGNDTAILDPSKGGAVLASGTLMSITAEYAETFRGSTVEDYSRPNNAYLAKGTTDVLVRQGFDSASEHYYYQLGSGRRVYMDDAAVYKENGKLTANTLSGGQTTLENGGTTITFGSHWKIPYNVELLPQKYRNANTSSQPSYDVSATGQTTEYVDITFYYTDTVPAAPDVSSSPLFSKAAWIKGKDHQYVLRLTLTRKAQFYGYSVKWESGGKMSLHFQHAPTVGSDAQPLKGMRILLDAGHGGSSVGTAAGSLPEKTLTLQYAKTLQQKLQALGATVHMTRTTDSNPTVDARMNAGRNNGTDLILSIHMDGSTSSATNGCSVHYFNEYSYLPAKTITEKMRQVERSYGIGSRQEVCLWNPFFITRVSDAPSMLIECGFMSNPRNLELLISDSYRNQLTGAIADGVVAYFESLPAMESTSSIDSYSAATPATASMAGSLIVAALPADSRKRLW